MKKNFFKQLAFGLAAAMVVTAAAPAAGTASAATTPSISKKAKNLYLNNEAVGDSYDFNIKNKVKGSTYKWTSSDTSVATVNSKNGVTTGKKVGTAKISCKITLPTKKTVTVSANVTVKKNATAIAINNVPENNTIGIGEKAYNFNRDLTDKDATDKTFWVIDEDSNTAGATVNTKNGVVTTTKAGEFKLTAYTYQNKDELAAKNWTATSETVTIKVAPTMTEVKQTAVRKFVATFDDNMSSTITKDSFTIVSATGVKSVVKEVSFSDDGKQVTVETHTDYEDKVTYKVTYDGKTVEFVASKGDVATVSVTPKTVQYQTPTEFDVQIFDANGIDLTTDSLMGNVTYDWDSNVGNIDTSEVAKPKLLIYNYNVTMNVKATYHTYKYENNKEIAYESPTVTFNSVEELKNTIKSVQTTIETDKADWNKLNSTMTAEKTYKLFIKGKDNNGDDLKIADCKFTSTDSSTLLVQVVNGEVQLYGVKAGSAHVKIEYGSSTHMVAVTVTDKSKATTMKADPATVTLYGSVADKDTADVTIKVYDQLGKEISYVETVGMPERKSTNTNTALAPSVVDKNKVRFTLTNTDQTAVNNTAGNHTYQVEYYGLKTNITVNVVKRASNTTPSYFMINFDSSSPVNAKVDLADPSAKTLVVKPVLYSAAGQKLNNITGTSIKSVSVKFNDKEIANSQSGVVSGVDTKAYYTDNSLTTGELLISLAYQKGGTTNPYVQAKAGTYKVTYTIDINNGTTTTAKTVSNTFVVENTQAIPSVEDKKLNVDAANLSAAISEAFKFSLDSSEITNYTVAEVDAAIAKDGRKVHDNPTASTIDAGVSAYIYSVTIEVPFTHGSTTDYIQYVIPVNKYITRK